MNSGEIKFIISEMSDILNFSFENVEVVINDNFSIFATEEKTVVECSSKSELCRALSVIKREFVKGNKTFECTQNRAFKDRGIMLDMSRNGVMRVEGVKKYIGYMAAFGLNVLWLYTEDTYELKEYPFLGYMRGRYTQDELKEIDDYAFSLGVEVIACIQTLGHMEQYLRWQEAGPVKDTNQVMLCGAEKTYEFIETSIKFFSETLRSRKIHIGMDEANDIGTGAYLAKNGYRDRCDIICEHLDKVCDICKKYGILPLMWSDMYCRMGSKIDYHYDTESKLDESVIEKIPEVDMVYWDYYHEGVDYYKKIIATQRPMKKHISFASGIWTWDGMLPNVTYTFKTMVPAMKACIEENIDTFIGTMWGDGGCETNQFYALFGLALLSEYTFSQTEPTDDDVYTMLKTVTGMERGAIEDIDSFNGRFEDVISVGNGQILAIRKGTQLIWNDILYNLIDFDTKNMKFEYDALDKCIELNDEWKDYYTFASTVIKIAEIKRDISKDLRKAYKENHKDYLKNLCENVLPKLKEMYEKAYRLHEKLWKKDYKVFGWEVLATRYITTIGRLEYAIGEFKKYLSGEIDEIEELVPETLFQKTPTGKYFRNLVSTSNLF